MKKYGSDSKQSWLIVLASCVIKFMTYGPAEVAGMLMVYTMHRFDTTREAASLPYTLLYTIRNGSGPMIAYVGNIIGLRSTILFGCILSSTAIGACFFAENVKTVTVLWGIIFGFGFAFEILLLNSITMEHFKNDLSKALGVTNAGAVLGICCFSPYLDFSVDSFGISGAFLLLAGATMHATPAALFILLNKPGKRIKFNTNQRASVSREYDRNTNDQRRNEDNVNCIYSAETVHQNDFHTQKNDLKHEKQCIYSSNFKTVCNDAVRTIAYRTHDIDKFKINSDKSNQWIPLNSKNNDTKYDNNIKSISTKTESSSKIIKSSADDKTPTKKLRANKLMKILFTHPIFWLILISNGMRYFVLPAYFTLLVDYAIDIGINPIHSKYVVIYSTCVEFVGCIVLGWLADLKFLSSNEFAITMFLCQTISLALMPCVPNIIFLAVVVLVFQWTQTGLSLIYPSVVSDSLEKEIQASALASMFILAAPLDLAISPLIGFFRDERGSYTGVYLTLALASFFACLSQTCILKCVNNKKQSTKT